MEKGILVYKKLSAVYPSVISDAILNKRPVGLQKHLNVEPNWFVDRG